MRRDPRGRRGPAGERLQPAALAVLAGVITLGGAVGVLPRWPGLIHFVALPPLDLVNDLGALLVAAPGWPGFLVGVGASLIGRAAVLTLVLGGLTRDRFGFALRFYAVVWPFAFVGAVLLYSAGALLFAALFWVGVALALALLALTGAVPWTGGPRVRDGLRSAARAGFRAGTIGAYVLVLTILGAVADLARPNGAVALVPVSAAATYVAASLLHADAGWRVARRIAAVVPAAGLLALLVIALRGPGGPERAVAAAPARAGSLMVMAGVDSSSGRGAMVEVDPVSLGWTCEQTFAFSYVGPGRGQPRHDAACESSTGAPYERGDTLRGREELVESLVEQATGLPEPVVIAGHSQAAWIAWEAAVSGRLPGVDAIVLVGTLPHNPVSYPEAGRLTSGQVGRFVLDHVDVAGISVFEPDAPLGRDWLGDPDVINDLFTHAIPEGLRVLSVTSMFDLPLMPDGFRVDGATNACPVPVIHPNLPYASDLREAVIRFAEREPQPRCPVWRELPGPLLRHFTVMPSR